MNSTSNINNVYEKKTSNEKVTPFITNSSTNLISMNKELLQSDNNKLNPKFLYDKKCEC